MTAFSWSLLVTAAVLGVGHTALGPDHYVPLALLARARGWSRRRTASVVLACGGAHVASSLLLAVVVAGLGAALAPAVFEHVRGQVAVWLIIAFGLAYGSWGLRRALRRSSGLEPHVHGDHVHVHAGGRHVHGHDELRSGRIHALSFWTLLTVFIVGPCEPLLPLLAVPAAGGRWIPALLIAVVFSVTTIATMVVLTLLLASGLARLPFGPLYRWSDALAGAAVAATGVLVLVLGL